MSVGCLVVRGLERRLYADECLDCKGALSRLYRCGAVGHGCCQVATVAALGITLTVHAAERLVTVEVP